MRCAGHNYLWQYRHTQAVDETKLATATPSQLDLLRQELADCDNDQLAAALRDQIQIECDLGKINIEMNAAVQLATASGSSSASARVTAPTATAAEPTDAPVNDEEVRPTFMY